jgi:hypothetical protein
MSELVRPLLLPHIPVLDIVDHHIFQYINFDVVYEEVAITMEQSFKNTDLTAKTIFSSTFFQALNMRSILMYMEDNVGVLGIIVADVTYFEEINLQAFAKKMELGNETNALGFSVEIRVL